MEARSAGAWLFDFIHIGRVASGTFGTSHLKYGTYDLDFSLVCTRLNAPRNGSTRGVRIQEGRAGRDLVTLSRQGKPQTEQARDGISNASCCPGFLMSPPPGYQATRTIGINIWGELRSASNSSDLISAF